MVIFGVDPGVEYVGWCAMNAGEGPIQGRKLLQLGHLELPNTKQHHRLYFIYWELSRIMRRYPIVTVAVEEGFIGKNPKTGMVLCEARAMVKLLAATFNARLEGVNPSTAKKAATGDGHATKRQVANAVKRMEKLKKIPNENAADAYAVAMVARSRLSKEHAV